MTPGYAKPRAELPWLPYNESDKVFVINSHNFGGGASPVLEFAEVVLISGEPVSISISVPSGTIDGDLLVASITKDSVASSISVPSGWTRIIQVANVERHDVFYKFADGTEGASVTFPLGANEGGSYMMARISGAAEIEAISNQTFDPPEITPSWGDSSFLVIAISTQRGGGTSYSAYPSGYTEIGRTVSISGLNSPEMAAAWKATSGSSENPGAFVGGGAGSGAGSPVASVTLAIRA